ncbi:MAG: sigma-70 family RNA polymerase sigma factor [Eubacteriales bacterium]|nr:sigma-70 family RNA polymerase sigma factor [Eubacteriales bacterium]
MKLNVEQQRKVEENLGLVNKVINDKVHGPYELGIYTRDDLFQIGCIGLCKAAATDKGGTFSTYAYRLIWNQICDALIYSTRRMGYETSYETLPEMPKEIDELSGIGYDIEEMLDKAEAATPPSTAKGIRALRLMSQGFTCREIGQRYNASDKLVCAWMSKARKYLRNRPDIAALVNN